MKEKIMAQLQMVDKFNYVLPSDLEYHANEIMKLIDAEVERRIKERMPSEEEKEAAEIMQHLKAYGMIHPVTAVKYPEGTHEDFIKRADEWIWRYRSRLTNPGDSQKTEGGE